MVMMSCLDTFFSVFKALLTFAQRVEYAWSTRRIRVEYARNTRGIRVEYAWKRSVINAVLNKRFPINRILQEFLVRLSKK